MISILGMISFRIKVARIRVKKGPKLNKIECNPIGKYLIAINNRYVELPDIIDLNVIILNSTFVI